MKKIVVPDEMLKAVFAEVRENDFRFKTAAESAVYVALCWLANNPILPTLEQINSMVGAGSELHWGWDTKWREHTIAWLAEWQKRMLFEPQVPEAVKDLMWSEALYKNDPHYHLAIPKINETIIEAYSRGRNSK